MRVLCLLLALMAPAGADEPKDVSDADAYCRFTRSVGASQDALLFIPSLFLDYGVVNGNDVTSGAGGLTAGPPLERLTIGARWSLMGIGRGIVDLKRASADCERYRAASGLARFLV